MAVSSALQPPASRNSNRLGRCSIGRQALRRAADRKGIALSIDTVAAGTLSQLMRDPDFPVRTSPHAVIKQGRSTVLVRTELRVDRQQRAIAYKQIRQRNWWKILLAPLRRDRALRAFRYGYRLLARGIPTPQPLVAIAPRGYRMLADSFLATEWIEGGRDLHWYCLEIERLDSRARHRRTKAAAESLAQTLAAMHNERISNRDLKAGNLLLKDDDGSVQAFLIDLDGVHFRCFVSWNLRWRNLARLSADLTIHPCVSRTVRLRFLKAYLQAAAGPAPPWKQAWRRLACRETRHLARRAKGTWRVSS